MYFIGKLDAYEIEDLNGIVMHVGNAKKTDDLSKYKKVKKLYSLLNSSDEIEDLEAYTTIKVYLFEELAKEELADLLYANEEYWKGYEVIEYGQELKDTVASMMNSFKYQIIATKQVDENGNPTGNYGMSEPLDFHSMVLKAEEIKEEIIKVSEKIREEKRAEFEKAQTSLSTKIKYNIIKAIDWSFKPYFDIFMSIPVLLLSSFVFIFFSHKIGLTLMFTAFFILGLYFVYSFFCLIANTINKVLFSLFKKIFHNYYE